MHNCTPTFRQRIFFRNMVSTMSVGLLTLQVILLIQALNFGPPASSPFI